MATRSAESPSSIGLNATYHPASGSGDKVEPGVLLHVRNGSASTMTIKLVTALVFDINLGVSDRNVAIAADGEQFIRVPNSTVYTNAEGLVDIEWTATTNVDFAVLI